MAGFDKKFSYLSHAQLLVLLDAYRNEQLFASYKEANPEYSYPIAWQNVITPETLASEYGMQELLSQDLVNNFLDEADELDEQMLSQLLQDII